MIVRVLTAAVLVAAGGLAILIGWDLRGLL